MKHVLEENKSKVVLNQITLFLLKKPLELLHIDLFGPVRTTSLAGKQYGFVIVDDFSRYTWVLFLKHKDEAFEIFCSLVQNEKESNIISVRSDHGGEFENLSFKTFFDKGFKFENLTNLNCSKKFKFKL